jgi:predicted metal-dependent hydrolase
MSKKTIEIDGIGNVSLIKRRGNNHIRLSFARDGSVRVSLPFYISYQAGIEFAHSRLDWIQKHRPVANIHLSDGDRIGKAHRLKINVSDVVHNPRVSLKENTVVVSCPVDIPVTHKSVQKAAERGALKALKREADQLLPQRLRILAAKYGFNFSSVSTKRLSSRWGSCSQAKEIILNTYLMQLPWELIDYVIIHELIHTEHLNHSEDFWERFEKVLPDAKKRRKILKTYRTAILPG